MRPTIPPAKPKLTAMTTYATSSSVAPCPTRPAGSVVDALEVLEALFALRRAQVQARHAEATHRGLRRCATVGYQHQAGVRRKGHGGIVNREACADIGRVSKNCLHRLDRLAGVPCRSCRGMGILPRRCHATTWRSF